MNGRTAPKNKVYLVMPIPETNTMRRILLASLLLLLAMPALHGQGMEQHDRVRIWFDDAPRAMERLGALGLAVDHGDLRPGAWVETDLSLSEIARARSHGFRCEVIIADVATWYVARNSLSMPEKAGDGDACGGPPAYPVPAHFTLGSMGGHYIWEEMLDILDLMHAEFPGLISAKQEIGLSLEGRPIHMVRMSNDPDVEQGKPEVFYNALHHAREPGSLSQLIFFMWHLLENYGSDPEATYLLDHFELYFVPCVNPDGYVYNHDMAPEGGGMWRKNRRPNAGGSFGVDLNRNYGHAWGYDNSGSSGSPESQVYRGTEPFSEPETRAIRDFCASRNFRLAMNNHTFGGLLIHPWGYLPSFFTPDSAVFAEYGAHIAEHNRYLHGTGDQTVNYVVNGGSDDWMYAEQDIFSMTPEAGFGSDGFWPPSTRIVPICQDMMAGNLRTAHLAGVYGMAADRSPGILDGPEAHIVFHLTRLGQEAGDLIVSLEPLENVSTTGAPIVFSDMALLETRIDSIAFTPAQALLQGEVMRFVLSVSNGAYTLRDTLIKRFGTPLTVLVENGSSMAQWQTNTWGLSSAYWHSPPTSITDSPNGDYPNNNVRTITLAQPFDLTDATSAVLTFMARWDIEARFDYAQVYASSDGSTWVPLCGRYTRPGGEAQDEGQPVYDGQRYTWVREEITLDDFLGEEVRLRFRMISDAQGRRDGFYFDDLRVMKTIALGTGIPSLEPVRIAVMPNPAVDHCWVTWSGAAQGSHALVLRDALGAEVQRWVVSGPQGSMRLDVSGLPAGVYLLQGLFGDRPGAAQRLVVVRP